MSCESVVSDVPALFRSAVETILGPKALSKIISKQAECMGKRRIDYAFHEIFILD